MERVFSKWGSFEASILVSYMDELILGVYPAGLYSFKGGEWRLIYKSEEPGFSAWSYDVFKGKLYIGAGTLRHALILEYDGVHVRESLKLPDGAGGGGGLFEAVSCIGDTLYAGRRNEVWATKDGEEWRRVYTFNSGKGIYLIASLGDAIFAFEGEPIRPPTRVYKMNEYEESIIYPLVGAFRSHTPSSRSVYRGNIIVADFDGRVYFYNGVRLWEVYSFASRYECGWNIAVRPKKIGDILFLAAGTGTGVIETHGELVAFAGERWQRIAVLPLNIHDVEGYEEGVYIACNSAARPMGATYNSSYCCVLRVPDEYLRGI